MKKIVFVILSIVLLGCNKDNDSKEVNQSASEPGIFVSDDVVGLRQVVHLTTDYIPEQPEYSIIWYDGEDFLAKNPFDGICEWQPQEVGVHSLKCMVTDGERNLTITRDIDVVPCDIDVYILGDSKEKVLRTIRTISNKTFTGITVDIVETNPQNDYVFVNVKYYYETIRGRTDEEWINFQNNKLVDYSTFSLSYKDSDSVFEIIKNKYSKTFGSPASISDGVITWQNDRLYLRITCQPIKSVFLTSFGEEVTYNSKVSLYLSDLEHLPSVPHSNIEPG